MDLQLTGKVALVTGSSAGIGTAIAMVLAREGSSVILHGRNEDRARAAAERISGNVKYVLGDLNTDVSAAKVFADAETCFGKIDILVNNAGSYAAKPWFDTTPDSWAEFYQADVLSAVRLILAAVPGMKRRGWGRLIQISSGLASTPGPVMPDYAAAKAAIVNATVSLAKAVAGTGITSNVISPGLINTGGVEQVLKEHAAKANWGTDWKTIQKRWIVEMLDSKYVPRLGDPDEVADLVAFVASPRAEYINGADLRVDCGLSPAIN